MFPVITRIDVRKSGRSWGMSVLAACFLVVTPAGARAESPGELARYVAAPDASYAWREVKTRRVGSAEVTELILTSQTWRDIPWKHHLVLVRPPNVDASSRQVLLFIEGGRWKPEHENGFQGSLPPAALIFTRLAETLRAPIAVLLQVPFQPMFDRREDALIAYTFDNYLAGGETDWPLLLPMVKSTVRAMDTIQAFARERWQMPVTSFTVSGASKRGWTSWLTAAVDPRVSSVAPIAIDMLNLPAQIALQRETFGGLSEQVQDYVAIDLPGRVASERGRSLMAMVDPYAYLADLTPPKLILLGTNDRVLAARCAQALLGRAARTQARALCAEPGPRRAGPWSPDRGVERASPLFRARRATAGADVELRRASRSARCRRADEPRTTPRARVDCEERNPGFSRGALDVA